MYLADVNIFITAFRPDAEHHRDSLAFLNGQISGSSRYACSDHVLSGFLRVATNRRSFKEAATIGEALAFAEVFRSQQHFVSIAPGSSHWSIFAQLARDVDAKGNIVADAFFAALAIESSCEWVTYDRDYARFKGLRWATPTEILARGY
jgi:toxin-antitoxin system PIN domain toxin